VNVALAYIGSDRPLEPGLYKIWFEAKNPEIAKLLERVDKDPNPVNWAAFKRDLSELYRKYAIPWKGNPGGFLRLIVPQTARVDGKTIKTRWWDANKKRLYIVVQIYGTRPSSGYSVPAGPPAPKK
jgi:hypothetical protein